MKNLLPRAATPPEIKRMWIRVLKRVHADVQMDEQDRDRRERSTQQANEENARRDEFALKVLELKRSEPRQAAPTEATNHPPQAPPQLSGLTGHEAFGILWAACAVICLLLYVIVEALRETVGRKASLCFLVLLTAAVVWWITKSSRLSHNQKAKWVVAVASGIILMGVSVLDSRPRANPLFPPARAATAQPTIAIRDSGQPLSANTTLTKATVSPGPMPRESLASQLSGYIEGAKNQVAQKWDSSEVAAGTPAGATVYIQFAIRRRGSHEVPTMESSSGYPSLDASCLRAVNQVRTFEHLPRRYSGDSLTVLYHCTYPGSPAAKFAQDSTLQPAQQPSLYGPVDEVPSGEQPTKGAVVTN